MTPYNGEWVIEFRIDDKIIEIKTLFATTTEVRNVAKKYFCEHYNMGIAQFHAFRLIEWIKKNRL